VRIVPTIAPGAETVRGDRDRLEQALQNLTANALRYSPPDSTVSLSARPEGSAVVLAIADQGRGIAAEHVPHVFDRFYKVDASRVSHGGPASSPGSGLGLSIVKAIVERHGGSVKVQSDPGHTEFAIRLPSRQPA
jgi:signal transduction histidine kinase